MACSFRKTEEAVHRFFVCFDSLEHHRHSIFRFANRSLHDEADNTTGLLHPTDWELCLLPCLVHHHEIRRPPRPKYPHLEVDRSFWLPSLEWRCWVLRDEICPRRLSWSPVSIQQFPQRFLWRLCWNLRALFPNYIEYNPDGCPLRVQNLDSSAFSLLLPLAFSNIVSFKCESAVKIFSCLHVCTLLDSVKFAE